MKLENKYSDEIIERGEGYLNSIKYCIKIGNFIYGKVEGSTTYKTEVELDSLEGNCSCPYGTNCKHAVALYLTYQKGRFSEAEGFIKSLDTMSKNGLKELLLSKLQDNPDWIIKHNLRKSANTKDFLANFKKHFSSDKITEAEAILQDLTFEKLLELHDYIADNYDDLAEKLGEEKENSDYDYEYGYGNDEEYDSELFDLHEKLTEVVVTQSLEKGRVLEVVKRLSLRDEIIKKAESFLKFRKAIKKHFINDEYLKFLLNLKSPDILEIKNYVHASNKELLYDLLNEKTKLIKNIAQSLKDKVLLFSVAVRENDFNALVDTFSQFENALKRDYDLAERLGDVVRLFMKKSFKNGEIAKKLLSEYEEAKYENEQIRFLASQITDYEFIKDAFNKDRIETHVELLERMSEIDKARTLQFVKNKKDLLHRHWSYIIPLFSFLRKICGKKEIEQYIRENQDFFKTSSHLKKHLKEECGVFISQREGTLLVEIR